MNGQIVLIGWDKEAEEKLLIIEASHEGDKEDDIDTVTFKNYDVSVKRKLLLDAIEFLRAHQQ